MSCWVWCPALRECDQYGAYFVELACRWRGLFSVLKGISVGKQCDLRRSAEFWCLMVCLWDWSGAGVLFMRVLSFWWMTTALQF